MSFKHCSAERTILWLWMSGRVEEMPYFQRLAQRGEGDRREIWSMKVL